VALWERAVTALPNRKLAAAEAVYVHAGLCHRAHAERLAKESLQFSWRYYLHLAAMLDRRRREQLTQTVTIEHPERLRAALAEGRGLIIACAHLGEFEVVAARLAEATERQIVAVVDTVAQRSRQAFFDAVREACGLVLRRATTVQISDLANDLAAGRILALMVDRAPRSSSVGVQILGRDAQLSVLPYVLASRTGAPVLAAAAHNLDADTRVAKFGELHQGVCAGHAAELTQSIAAELGCFIREAPSQWHVPADINQLPFTTS
jgi:KDO2-lipid IV(A) lauroyltransferase